MANSHRTHVNIAEVKQEIQQEAKQLKSRSPLAIVPVKAAIDGVKFDTTNIEELLRNAESRAYERTSWPSTLDRFPLSLLKPLNRLVLKILNLIFKDQREVNYNLVQGLRESIALNQELIKQLKAVQTLMVDYSTNAISQTSTAINQASTAINQASTAINQASAATSQIETLQINYAKDYAHLTTRLEDTNAHFEKTVAQLGELMDWSRQIVEPELQDLKRIEPRMQELLQNVQSLEKTIISLNEAVFRSQEFSPSFSVTQESYLSQAIALSQIPFSEIQQSNSKSVFYYLFENVFYNPSVVKEKQKIYLPYINKELNQTHPFLDAGCGRGEFLHNLTDEGMQAVGVDLNELEVELLQSQGLTVSLSDILAYLKTNSQTYSGISAFQVIEHLTYDYLNDFLADAFQHLASKGVIILETVNPHCLYGLSNFYQDPTHVKPIPPEMLSFLLEWHGFRQLQILYSSLVSQPLQIFVEPKMNYQDYAVIGYKP